MPKRKRQTIGPYVAVPKAITQTPAWRELSPSARLLWIELRGQLRNDYSNNGKVYRSGRNAAKALNVNRSTILRSYSQLERYGFIRQTVGAHLGSEGHGFSAHYRFTDLAHGSDAPTLEFQTALTGELVMGAKCNHPKGKTMDLKSSHSLNGSKRPTMDVKCNQGGRKMQPGFQISKRGSSTARAPAQAGGAGSSPAPVAKRVRVPKRGTEPHRDWADARRHDLSASLRRVRRRRHQAGDAGAAQPMCWATPRLVEVTDPVEAAAIQAYWRPRVAVSA